MKFGPNWPSGLGGDVNCKQTTDDARRTTDAGELAYQNSHLCTMCSGELKKANSVDSGEKARTSPLIWIYTVCKTFFLVCGVKRVNHKTV